MFKIGQSRDVHRFSTESNKPLIIGMVEIDSEFNIEAHSDGDVLVHAIVEAIIGAMGLGDLGTLFPDTSKEYLNISSVFFLKEIKKIIDEKGYSINNIDSTIHIEKPMIKPYVNKMKKNIADVLKIDESCINIKATRGEKIGYIGRCEGVEAECIVLLEKKDAPKIVRL